MAGQRMLTNLEFAMDRSVFDCRYKDAARIEFVVANAYSLFSNPA
jgi:hypothetical protein